MTQPIAVLISDIHFNIKNLEIATTALKAAIIEAEHLSVPLIIAGDLNDTKAIIRAEVANRLIELIRAATIKVYIIVGNHDLINEKSVEHSLNFLSPYAYIIDTPQKIIKNVFAIPYNQLNDNSLLKAKLAFCKILITHQGFHGAFLGDYVQDKTSISPDLVKDYKVFSGHYHRHQNVSTVTYIGSPYTESFGETNDGPKGFLVIYQNGDYKQEVLNLRKHVKFSIHARELKYEFLSDINKNDLLWITVLGTKEELAEVDLKHILDGYNYKLDLIPDETPEVKQLPKINSLEFTDAEKFDMLIDEAQEKNADELKKLWKSLI